VWTASEPGFDLGMLMSREVVSDQVQFKIGRLAWRCCKGSGIPDGDDAVRYAGERRCPVISFDSAILVLRAASLLRAKTMGSASGECS
jgi:hypothetical protein